MKKMISLLLMLTFVINIVPAFDFPVFAAADENIALGKIVTAKDTRDGYNPNSVGDGDRNSMWAGSSGVDGNWIMIDLGEAYTITSVIVQPRTDTATAYFRRKINVEFSNTPDFSQKEMVVDMGDNEPPLGEAVTVTPPSKTPYRYVRAIRMDANTFTLNEIEVYGYIPGSEGLTVGTDVSGTEVEGAVTLLRYLGVMNLKDELDEVFGVNTLLSRGEAAEEIVNVFGSATDTKKEVPFSDVPITNKYYPSIATAYNLGYITGCGDSTFRPNDYITHNEFMYMVLRAIGYGDIVQKLSEQGTYKVTNLAKRIGLFDNVSVTDYTAPVSRGDAAVIFYNALLVPEFVMSGIKDDEIVFSEGTDMLRSRYNLVLTQGIVTENGITSLEGDAKSDDTSAKLGNKRFLDPDGMLDAYLGKEVVVAADINRPDVILVAWSAMEETEIVITADNMRFTEADVKAGVIKAYDDSGNLKSYNLEGDYYVVRNNIAYPYYEPSELIITNGQLRLLDNDGDRKYEVVFVDEYSLHYVTNAFYDDEEFTFIDSEGVRKTLDKDKLIVTDAQGGSGNLKKIESGVVIKFFAHGSNKHSRIAYFNAPVSGQLTMISDNEISVGTNTYPLSLSYRSTIHNPRPELDEHVEVFLDEKGEVIWIERDTDKIDGQWTLAFSQAYDIGSGLNKTVGLRLFTEKGEWKELYAAEKVILDGISVTKSVLADTMSKGASGRFKDELIRYKLNTLGEISELDTLTKNSAEAQRGISLERGQRLEAPLYTTASQAFWSSNQMLMPALRDTVVFTIPTVGGKPATGEEFDDLYRIRQLSSVVTTHQYTQKNLQSYMQDEFGYPACFMVTQGYPASSGSSSAVAVTSGSAPFLLVEKVSTSVTESGEVAIKVSGIGIDNSGMNARTHFFAKPGIDVIETGLLYQNEPTCLESEDHLVDMSVFGDLEDKKDYMTKIEDIGFGDVVRYQSGVDTVYAVERVYDYNSSVAPALGKAPDGATWYIAGGRNTDHYIGHFRYQFGTLSKVNSSVFTVTTLSGHDETYLKTSFGAVYVCKEDGRMNVIEKIQDVGQYEGTDAVILLYSYNGSPKGIVVYP